jgi:hypothetical protein
LQQLQKTATQLNPTGSNWTFQLLLLGFHNEQLQLYNWLQPVAVQ